MTESTATIALLGAFEVRVGGAVVAVTAAQQRTVLATLACAAPDVVAADELIEVLYGASPPATARTALHNTVRRLRTRLEAAGAVDVVATEPEGYRLTLPADADADAVDAVRFRRLLERARASAARAEAYAEAVSVWRGDPATDLPREGRLGQALERLEEERCQAAEEWADAEVRAGRPERPLVLLRELAARWPLRESLRARLVLALHAAGRTADALAEYTRARRTLVDELGVEPGAALREAHRTALRPDEPVVAAPAVGPVVTVVVPAQLPDQPAGLHGREAEAARLDTALRAEAAPAVQVVSGPPGVGKTALAVRWARRVADRFPDGQLFCDLRGFDPAGSPLTTDGVLRGFLVALGVPVADLPSDPDGMVGLYRSLLANRRVLVVLDNARDAAQVRPLLPGGAGCLAVVTSRHELGALALTHRIATLTLAPLPDDDAWAVLVDAVGRERIEAERAAAAEVVAGCGGLPLALSVAAAQLAAHPDHTVGDLAARLRRAASPLDVLRLDDPVADVRAVLSWSVRALRPLDARTFAHLGLHPGPEAGLPAVAALVGLAEDDARESVGRLVAAHLALAPAPDRVGLHDLVRAHAVEVAAHDLADHARAAVARLVDHHLRSAVHATRQLFSTPLPFVLGEPVEGSAPQRFDDVDAATRWLERELPVLVRVVDLAAATPGKEPAAWRLARVLNGFLWDRCQWHEMQHMQESALAAAVATEDRAGEADARHGLADCFLGLGRLDDAYRELDAARAVFADLGDAGGEGDVLTTRARALEAEGRYAEALATSEEALVVYERVGDRSGRAVTTNNLAWILTRLGRHEDAVAPGLEAVRLYKELGDNAGLTYALDTVGRALLDAGDPETAVGYLAESTELSRRLGQRLNQALNHEHLGEAYLALGDLAGARAAWESARGLLQDLGHEAAGRVGERLAALPDAHDGTGGPSGTGGAR